MSPQLSRIPGAWGSSPSCTRTPKQGRCWLTLCPLIWVLWERTVLGFHVHSLIAETDRALRLSVLEHDTEYLSVSGKSMSAHIHHIHVVIAPSSVFVCLFMHILLIKEYVLPLGGVCAQHQPYQWEEECLCGWECSGCHPGFLGLSVQLGGLMAIWVKQRDDAWDIVRCLYNYKAVR